MNESAAEKEKTPAISTAATEQPANGDAREQNNFESMPNKSTAANGDHREAGALESMPDKSTAASEQPANADDSEEDAFESMPDDLNDFIVVDEAEITDDECANQEQDSGKLSKKNQESKQWDCPVERLAPRTYTEEDFNPTTRDPRCKADWPLATFWPVYVSNFRLFRKSDADYNCAHAIHTYFASKGLPSFMVFRLKDEFFTEYQKVVGLYDMLVYFCCRKDANRATDWCHRDLYYGHRLNVYSGRSPIYFSTQKAVHFKPRKTEYMFETEGKLERYFHTFDDVSAISKQDLDGVFVQFRKSTCYKEFPGINRYDCTPLAGRVQKQRFIEQDVEAEILQEIADNPKFMQCRLKKGFLTSLMHGVIPVLNRGWEKPESFGNRKRSPLPSNVHVNSEPALNNIRETVKYPKRKKIVAVTPDEWKQLQALRHGTPTNHSAPLATSQPNNQLEQVARIMNEVMSPIEMFPDPSRLMPPEPEFSDHQIQQMAQLMAQIPNTVPRQRVPPKRKRGKYTYDQQLHKKPHLLREMPADEASFVADMPEGLTRRQIRQRIRGKRRVRKPKTLQDSPHFSE